MIILNQVGEKGQKQLRAKMKRVNATNEKYREEEKVLREDQLSSYKRICEVFPSKGRGQSLPEIR